MKVKILTSFLNVLFLWGSLAAYSQENYSASSREIKAAQENGHVAVAPSITSTEETTDFPKVIFGDFSFAKEFALHHKIITSCLVSIHKPFKAYIVFRVLRN